ncbi:hypothetical protein [Pseudomonas reinekei]|uniref:Uncharacterized protein n=1 Tax=Pseudomonas reinekei TaxID=395598 RepID=A0A6H9R692_PSERE|nr:hypothetical protein [Pseudomonas reinekei]KAB0482013.1 hypothetical protein F7R15_24110 [Pseudomonas reinekei]
MTAQVKRYWAGSKNILGWSHGHQYDAESGVHIPKHFKQMEVMKTKGKGISLDSNKAERGCSVTTAIDPTASSNDSKYPRGFLSPATYTYV